MTSIPTQEESNRLFREYQDGGNSALGELYRRWHGYVTQRVKKSNAFSDSDIEDISSNVWVLVQQQSKKWDVDRSGWFRFLDYKIRDTISNELMRRKRRHRILKENGYVEIQELPTDINHEKGEYPSNFDVEAPLNNSRTVGSALYVDPEPSPLENLIDSERHEILEKAIRVCKFTAITEKVLRLRLKGLTIVQIQETLGLKQASCVKIHLQRALEDLKEVINPTTYEVSTIAPKDRRKREKQEYLQRAGRSLRVCVQRKALTLEAFARIVKINLSDLERYFHGKSKPEAARLNRLAAVVGEQVYDIYTPPLPRAQWAKQGQELWRMRVKKGVSLKKLSKISDIHYSVLTQYEAGTLKIPPATRSKLVSFFRCADC